VQSGKWANDPPYFLFKKASLSSSFRTRRPLPPKKKSRTSMRTPIHGRLLCLPSVLVAGSCVFLWCWGLSSSWPCTSPRVQSRCTIDYARDGELLLLACFHNSHDVPTLLNLVEAVIQQLPCWATQGSSSSAAFVNPPRPVGRFSSLTALRRRSGSDDFVGPPPSPHQSSSSTSPPPPPI
jgi:hypothetical protein